jgi:hypothetical protein
MVNLKKWEYVIKSLKKLNAPERAIDLVETIQEQLEVYDLNRNTIAWKYEGSGMIVGGMFDLRDVLEVYADYCYCCVSYRSNCLICPINSPSIKGCCKELIELIDIVAELDYHQKKEHHQFVD